MSGRLGPRRPRLAFRTTRLEYDAIPTLCDAWLLCVAPGANGPSFWPAWRADADDHSRECAVRDWETGIALLQDNGLTLAFDESGHLHVRYHCDECRNRVREQRQRNRETRARDGYL